MKSVRIENDVENDFQIIYETQIAPKLAPFEAYRKNRLKKYKLYKFLACFTILIFCIVLILGACLAPFLTEKLNLNSELTENIMLCLVYVNILFVLLAVHFYSLASNVDKNFRNRVKQVILPIILPLFGDFAVSFTDREEDISVVNLKELKDIGLFRYAAEKWDEDVIYGIYKDREISITETIIKRTKECYFQGLIIKTELKKPYDGKIIITNNRSGVYGPNFLDLNVFYYSKYKKNTDLDRHYRIYSNNEKETEALFNVNIIEKLEEAKKSLNVDVVDLVINGSSFYIFIDAIPRVNFFTYQKSYTAKNFFEVVAIDKTIYNIENFKKAYKDFASVFQLI